MKNTITKIGNDFNVEDNKKTKKLRTALLEGEESGLMDDELFKAKIKEFKEKVKKRLDKSKKIV